MHKDIYTLFKQRKHVSYLSPVSNGMALASLSIKIIYNKRKNRYKSNLIKNI